MYNAPEANQERHAGPSSDLFSAGIVLFIMLSGRFPFKFGASEACPLYKMISTGNYASFFKMHQKALPGIEFGIVLRDLLVSLWNPDPKQRPTMHEVIHHPWMTGTLVAKDYNR